MKTFKKTFLFIIFHFLFCTVALSQATLSIATVNGTPGNEMSIPVHATGITNMTTFQFTITYDNTKLDYVRCSNWALGVNTAQVLINPIQGRITFVYYNDESPISITSGRFFDLHFSVKPNSSGFSSINWSDSPTPRELSNSSFNVISCTYTNGKVNIPSGVSSKPTLLAKIPVYNHSTNPWNYQLLPADSRGYVSATFTLTFKDQASGQPVDVYPGNGGIRIYEYRYNQATLSMESKLWKTININDPSISFANNILTISAVKLRDNVNQQVGSEKECYYILIDNEAISNGHTTSPMYWDGFNSPYDWRFQTAADNEFASGFIIISPNIKRDGLGASNLPIYEAGTLIAEFNEGIKAISNPTGKVQLFKKVTNTMEQQVTVTQSMIDRKRLTVQLNPLEIGTNYYVVIQAGAFSDTSFVPTPNTAFGGIDSWEFRTVEPRSPVATLATNVSTYGFTANWDIFPNATSYYIDVSMNNSFDNCITGYKNKDVGNTNELTIEDLLENTTYYYRIRALHPGGMSTYSNTMHVTTSSNSITILPLTVGVNSVESISIPGEIDWFKFKTSNSPGTYTVQTFGYTDTYIELYDSERKTILNFNDDDGEFDNGKITQYLNADTWYCVKVKGAIAEITTGNYTIRVDRVLNLNLVAPSELSSSVGNKQVSLFWDGPFTGPLNYTIYCKTSYNERFIRITDTKEKNIIFDNLKNGSTYWYCIKANYSNGQSAISNIISVTPGFHPLIVNAPPYFSVITLKGEIDAYMFKTSTPGTYTIETYGETDTYLNLYDSDGITQLHFNNDGGTNKNAKIAYSLLANSWYYFEVKGVNSTISGNYSVDVKGGEPLILYPPRNVSASATNAQWTINWMEPETGTPTGYNVYLSNNENGPYTLTKENLTDLSTTLYGLTNGIKYWAYITAIYEVGESTTSNKVYGIPMIGTPPPTPIAVAASSIGMNNFTANWDYSEGAMGFYLDISIDVNFNTFLTGFQNKNVGDVASFTISGLSANTTYYYRIRAYNLAGTSNYSNTITLRTTNATAPSAPVALAATAITAGGFTANWNRADNATGYFIDVSLNNSFTSFIPGFQNKNVENVTSFPITGLETNQTYYYRVKAINANGSSTYSNIITVRTLSDINCFTIISPIPGSTNNILNPLISIEFCVDRILIKPDGYIMLSDQSLAQVPGVNFFTFTVNDMVIENNKLSIQTNQLQENMTYTVSIPYGAITDLSGNPFHGLPNPKYWMFSTGGVSAPVVSVPATTINNNATGTVSITSNKAGTVYLVRNDIPKDAAAIVNAIQQNKCKGATLLSPGSVVINAENLLPGTYYACVVDESGTIGIAQNEVTVVSASEIMVKTFKEIQGQAASSPFIGSQVKVRGVISAITSNGFYMQDENTPWSGIFVSSTNPVFINQSVQIIGSVAEVNGTTCIINVTEFTTIPQLINLQAVPVTSSLEEKHESVFIYITAHSDISIYTSGIWQAGIYTIDNSLLGSTMMNAGNYYGINGVVVQQNDSYKLLATQLTDLTVGSGNTHLSNQTLMYPNPFCDFVRLNNAENIRKVSVYNLSGQFVEEFIDPGQLINTSKLRTGLYYFQIENKDGSRKAEKLNKN
jgi:hypothetical protein